MKKFIRSVSIAIIISIMTINIGYNYVFSQERDLSELERERIKDAVKVLEEFEEEEWVVDVLKWLDEGKIKTDSDMTERAQTKKDGTIIIRSNILRELTQNQKEEPLKKWVLDADLARTLVHEKKHAHYQAPNSSTFKENGIKASDWDEVYIAFEICTGPEATEVEAYYTFLHMLCEWWEKLEKINTEEADKKQTEVFMMIWRWVKNLKDFNYEKQDYLSDLFDEFDKPKEKKTSQIIAETKAELEKRLNETYDENGVYDRARKAAEKAKKIKEEAESSIFEDVYKFFKDLIGISVSIDPIYIDDFDRVELALYDSYIKPPPGYIYIDFSGIDAPIMTIEYIGDYKREIPFKLNLKTEGEENSNMALFKMGNSKPSHWELVLNQKINKKTGEIDAITDGSGIYAILKPKSSYEDVTLNSRYYSYIHWLEERNIMIGIDSQIFGYGKSLTRAQYCSLIVKALKLEFKEIHTFEDVNYDDWYNDFISIAYSNGLINGESKYKFSPNKNISKEQAMILMVRASGYNDEAVNLNNQEVEFYLKNIKDANKISSWARAYVAQAIRSGILMFDDNEEAFLFRPQESISREEASKLIYIMMVELGLNKPISD